MICRVYTEMKADIFLSKIMCNLFIVLSLICLSLGFFYVFTGDFNQSLRFVFSSIIGVMVALNLIIDRKDL